jgi:hypothetical protein
MYNLRRHQARSARHQSAVTSDGSSQDRTTGDLSHLTVLIPLDEDASNSAQHILKKQVYTDSSSVPLSSCAWLSWLGQSYCTTCRHCWVSGCHHDVDTSGPFAPSRFFVRSLGMPFQARSLVLLPRSAFAHFYAKICRGGCCGPGPAR